MRFAPTGKRRSHCSGVSSNLERCWAHIGLIAKPGSGSISNAEQEAPRARELRQSYCVLDVRADALGYDLARAAVVT
jgi:hypothetical protein